MGHAAAEGAVREDRKTSDGQTSEAVRVMAALTTPALPPLVAGGTGTGAVLSSIPEG